MRFPDLTKTKRSVRKYIHPKDIIKNIDLKNLAGTNILFINMPIRESAPPNCLPTGIALLSSRLKLYECKVSAIDLNAYRFDDGNKFRCISGIQAFQLIKRHIEKYGMPDLVAFSGMITTLRWQEKIAKIIRQIAPDSFIVSGGGLATEFKEDLFSWIPELDAVAHSEGDLSILKIAWDSKKIKMFGFDYCHFSGMLKPYHIGRFGNRERFVYDGGRPDNLELVPLPDYDLFREDVDGFPILETYLKNQIWGIQANNSSATPFSMQRSINMISSRGCPFACNFCFRKSFGDRNYGIRSGKSMADEMLEYAAKYKIDFIGVLDDNFMVDRKRIIELPEKMKMVKSIGIKWGTHGRLDEAADLKPEKGFNDPLRVEKMAEAGCVYIGFGAESASERIIKAMGKNGFILSNGSVEIDGWEFPKTMVEGVKNTKKAGIHANLTWIMGYPGETLEDLKNTIAFIKWQEDFYKSFDAQNAVNKKLFIATAYPGTEMFEHPTVKRKLSYNFGVKFDEHGIPCMDDNFHYYVSGLDDADKLLTDRDGRPLHYGEMTDESFLEAKRLVDNDRTFDILEMAA